MYNKLLAIIFLFFIHTTVKCEKNGELVAVAAIFRHGERTPIFAGFTKDSPGDKNIATGQLTNHGKKQLYDLGKWLRNRYSNFLSEYYSHEDVKIVSTATDRSLMSAAGLAAGLYPPKDHQIWMEGIEWQPVPIHPVEKGVVFRIDVDCANYLKLLIAYYKQTESARNFLKKSEEIRHHVNKYMHGEIDNFLKLAVVADNILTLPKENFTIPDWIENLDKNVLNEIIDFVFNSFGSTEDLLKISVGPFLQRLTTHFTDLENGNKKHKLLLFSAHDNNLATLERALGQDGIKRRTFASMLIFELIKKDDQHYVQVFLKENDDIRKIPIRNCEDDCSLEDFKQIIGPIMISLDEWNEMCSEKMSIEKFLKIKEEL